MTSPTTRTTHRRSRTPTTTLCAAPAGDRGGLPGARHAAEPERHGRRGPVTKVRLRPAPRADALARQRLRRRGGRRVRGPGAALPRARAPTRRSPSRPSPRSTACRARLRYEAGRLVQAATRGDGFEGEDVTANVRTVRADPAPAHGRGRAGRLEVRGEIFMTEGRFRGPQRPPGRGRPADLRQSAQLGRRARCASSIPTITAERPLQFFAYAWGEMSALPATTQSGMIAAFARFGLPTNPLTVRADTVEALLAHYRAIEAQRADAALRHRRRRLQGRRPRAARTGSASCRARRAGPWRTSSRPSGPRRVCSASTSRSAAPASLTPVAQAAARHGRRRRGRACHAAQRGRDRPQGRAGRRHGAGAAGRRRHPADPRRRARTSARPVPALRVPRRLPGLRLGRGARDRPEDRHGRRGAPLHRRARLPGPGRRAAQAFLLAQCASTSRAWATSRSSCSTARG